MKIRVKFNYNEKNFVFERAIEDLDRNYDDEEFAYFLEDYQGFKYGGFEINIFKDDDDNFTNEGYVCIYEDWDDCEPIEINNNCEITFVQEV